MKKVKILAVLSIIALSFGMFLPTAATVNAAVGKDNECELNLSIMNRWGTSGDNVFDSITHTEKGLEMVADIPINGVRSACSSQIFNVKDENAFTIEFSVPKFGVNDGDKTYKADYVEVYFRSENDADLKTWLRIYLNQPDATAYASECRIKTPETERSTQFRILPKILGNYVSFEIGFDVENNFSGYFVSRKNWTPQEWSDELVKKSIYEIETDNQNLSESNISLKEYKVLFDEIFENTESAQFVMKIGSTSSAKEAYTSKMIFSDICGQSLVPSEKGCGWVYDTVPPYLSPIKYAGGEIKGFSKYSFSVLNTSGTGSANLARPNQETEFYCDYASDLISFATGLKYTINLVNPKGETKRFDTLVFEVDDAGTYKISVSVTDNVGNTYTTDEYEFIAKDFFRIVFEEEFVTEARIGSKVTLPHFYARGADGSRVDIDGQPFSVSIKILNPFGIDVTETEYENSVFTPQKKGIYTIKYSSVSKNGESCSASKDIKVSEAEQKGGCGATVSPSFFLPCSLCLAAIYLSVKKFGQKIK